MAIISPMTLLLVICAILNYVNLYSTVPLTKSINSLLIWEEPDICFPVKMMQQLCIIPV